MQSPILQVLSALLVTVALGRSHTTGNTCSTGNTCTCVPQRPDVTVTWCKDNCFHNPPFCPASHCICSGKASSNTPTTPTTNAPTPVCTYKPVKKCTPKEVKTPRKVCQTVFDLYEDTIVTENCEKVVTTKCIKISQTSTNTSQVVDKSSRLVKAGIPKPISHDYAHHANTHAHAEAEPEPHADADAEAEHWYGHQNPLVSSPANKTVNPPECNSTTANTCHRVPVSTPRKVSRTVCETVVDVTTIQVCHKTVTKTCH